MFGCEKKREAYVIDNSCKSIKQVLVSDELIKIMNIISGKVSQKYKKSCIIHIRKAIVWNLSKGKKVDEFLNDDEIKKLERFLLDSQVEDVGRQIFEKKIKDRIRLFFDNSSFSEFNDWKIFVEDIVGDNGFDFIRNQMLLLLMYNSFLGDNPLTRDINFEKEDQLFGEIVECNIATKKMLDDGFVDLSFGLLKAHSFLKRNSNQFKSIELDDITIKSSRLRKFGEISFYVISIVIKGKDYIAIEIPDSIKSMDIKETYLGSKCGLELFRGHYSGEIGSIVDYNRIIFDQENIGNNFTQEYNPKTVDEFELFISRLSKGIRLINFIDIIILSQIMYKIFGIQAFKKDLSSLDSSDDKIIVILKQLELIFGISFTKKNTNTESDIGIGYFFYNNRGLPGVSRIGVSNILSISAGPFSV